MEKADVSGSSIKRAELKDAVFILTLDYPTISHHMAKTILHDGHNVYEKWMTASSSKFAAYIQGLCIEMTPLSLSIKFTFSIWRLRVRPTGISELSCSLPQPSLPSSISLIFKTGTAVRADSVWYRQIQIRVLTQGQCLYTVSRWYNDTLPVRLPFCRFSRVILNSNNSYKDFTLVIVTLLVM